MAVGAVVSVLIGAATRRGCALMSKEYELVQLVCQARVNAGALVGGDIMV